MFKMANYAGVLHDTLQLLSILGFGELVANFIWIL